MRCPTKTPAVVHRGRVGGAAKRQAADDLPKRRAARRGYASAARCAIPRRSAIRATSAVLLLTAAATTAPSTTGPATAPAVDPPIARWFDQLADPDPAVRDAAAERLSGLPADALPRLLAVARAARPVAPAQAAALYEIVRQAFLAGLPYDTAGTPKYILGQSWPFELRQGERVGVPVVNRWPGLPARRVLRDGDLILGLYADLDAPPDRPADVPTPGPAELIEAMQACPTQPRLALRVLRAGRPVRVTATMVVEPVQTADRVPTEVAAFLDERQRRADDYWQHTFAPVLCPPAAVPPEPLDGP